MTVLTLVSQATWGTDFKSLAAPNGTLVSSYLRMFAPPTTMRVVLAIALPSFLLMRIPTAAIRRLRRGMSAMREASQKAVVARRNERHVGKDLLSVAMRHGVLKDDQLVDQLLTLVAAGHETTAMAATWACVSHRLARRVHH